MTRTRNACALAVLLLLTAAPWAGAAEPIASAETNWEGVTLHLMNVERKGNVLTVKWAVTNDGDSTEKVYFVFTGNDPCYLVDEDSGTKYYVLTDKEGNALAPRNVFVGAGRYGVVDDLGPGKTLRYWMKFPAPPPEVEQIGIFFNDTEPLEEIAITDRE